MIRRITCSALSFIVKDAPLTLQRGFFLYIKKNNKQ